MENRSRVSLDPKLKKSREKTILYMYMVLKDHFSNSNECGKWVVKTRAPKSRRRQERHERSMKEREGVVLVHRWVPKRVGKFVDLAVVRERSKRKECRGVTNGGGIREMLVCIGASHMWGCRKQLSERWEAVWRAEMRDVDVA